MIPKAITSITMIETFKITCSIPFLVTSIFEIDLSYRVYTVPFSTVKRLGGVRCQGIGSKRFKNYQFVAAIMLWDELA